MPVLAESIVDLAKKTGFETELRVASLLRRLGWSVSQNIYYVDKDEGKSREIDIHAYHGNRETVRQPYITCGINLCIEVKKTSDPFVFFSSTPGVVERGAGYSHLHYKQKVDNNILPYNEIDNHKPMGTPLMFGRSYASLKEAKTAHIQAGIMSSVKGAIHFTDSCSERYNDKSLDISFFVPIVVVDGILMECYLESDDGELIVRGVNSIVYMQNYLSNAYGSVGTRVHVITLTALESQLIEYMQWGKAMHKVMVERQHGS
ncbi:hypothetical protein U1737_11575 [Sphingomonas sp. LB3N6]|uniref:hypothetical protein n=1 Tax=Sphingomonas fucosidasi TaxID=3096164 RepID=UPI002FCBA1A9